MNGRKEGPLDLWSADLPAWEDCCQGELGQMVDRMRTVRRRRFLSQASVAALTLAVTGAGISFAGYRWWLSGDYRYGGIACSEVMRLLPKYHAGELDAQLSRQIAIHLEQCPDCGPAYRRMIQDDHAALARS